MRVYRLERVQHIPRRLEDVFAFFAEAQNLQSLTPEFLHFRILTPLPLLIQAGILIDYRLQLFGMPLRWRTRIETFDPPRRFTDVQLVGPYHSWHHSHEFEQTREGTCMVDRVVYALPFAMLGTLAQALFVRRMLQRIFDYRAQRLATLLPPLA